MTLSRTFKAALAVTVFGFGMTSALAQSPNSNLDLGSRLNRIESALQDLQGVVYSVEQSAYGSQGSENDPYATSDTFGGDTAVRIDQMERELQQLTGRIEEVAYRIEMNSRRLDSLANAMAMGGQAPQGQMGDLMPGQPGGSGAAPQGLPPVGGSAPEAEDPNSLNAQYRRMQNQNQGPAAPATSGPVDLSGTGAFTGTLEEQEEAVANFDCAAALPTSADGIYDAAFDALLSGEYDSSECAFNKFLENYGDDPRASDAQFRLGDIYLATGANVDAAKAFLNHIRTWPQDARAPESYLKLGIAYSRLGKTAEACKIFGAIETKFPNISGNIRQRIAVERGAAGC